MFLINYGEVVIKVYSNFNRSVTCVVGFFLSVFNIKCFLIIICDAIFTNLKTNIRATFEPLIPKSVNPYFLDFRSVFSNF